MGERPRSVLWELFKGQLKVGCLGFGGPLAAMAMMRAEFVERRKIVDPDRYLEGVGAVKLLPGPVSSLLAVYLGTLTAGVSGGLVSILGFVLPSFLMILGICGLEARLGPEVFRAGDFLAAMHGVQIAVLVVIMQTCWKLFRDAQLRPYAGRPRPVFVAVCALIAAILSRLGFAELSVLLFSSLVGSVGLSFARPPAPRSTVQSPYAVGVAAIFATFFKAGLTVFGTGYMVIPYLQRVLVDENRWILAEPFLNGVAYGNLTPGPVVIASTYMGYRIAGLAGAFAATLGIFGGPLVLMLALAPVLRRVMSRPWVEGVLLGLLPAVAASIAVGTVLIGAELAWAPASFGILAAAALLAFARLKAPWVLLAGAGLGLLLGRL